MDQNILLALLISLVLVMSGLTGLERYLRSVFAPHDYRMSNLYQGGESISSITRGYQMENINLTMYFLVLHVIGFFGATLYILISHQINPLNWTTLGFGMIMLFSVFLIGKSTR